MTTTDLNCSLASTLIVGFELKKTLNKIEYLNYHLIRCKKEDSKVKLIAMLVGEATYAIKLTCSLNDLGKKTINALFPVPSVKQIIKPLFPDTNQKLLLSINPKH